MGLPRWAIGEHDHLQYHFFSEHLFVQARVFLTQSLEEHSLWIYDHRDGKITELVNCAEHMRQSSGDHLHLEGPQMSVSDGVGGGVLTGPDVTVEFKNRHVFSWLPAGQGDNAVIHRPDLDLAITYKGEKILGRGYSKRYFGKYGPHWGYRFIQSSDPRLGKTVLWTADATFCLGDGEAKYNYWKLLDSDSSALEQAQSEDTWQQDCKAFAHIDGRRCVAEITPVAEWMHDYDKGRTNSRMQLRYCKLRVDTGKEVIEGYALNERCFGTL